MKSILLLCALSAAATVAHADISDSGNLTIGGSAVIAGTQTVQGNAFSVGGSTFSVSAGTITAGVILKVSAAGIKWADGTTSTTAALGAGNAVVNASSCTRIPETVFTQANFVLAAATVTLTVGAVPLEFIVSGAIGNNSPQNVGWNVLIDGNFATSYDGTAYSPTSGMAGTMTATAECADPGPPALIPAISAGSHTFAISLVTGSGTSAFFVNGTAQCQGLVKTVKSFFCVRESR